MFSFILNDSSLYLSGSGDNIYLSEKIIPAGVYQDMNLILGDSTQTDTANNKQLPAAAIEVFGTYNNDEFLIHSKGSIELGLSVNPPLKVNKNSDSLSILTIYFDSSEWFQGMGNTGLLDPTDSNNSDQIVANILESAGLSLTANRSNPGGKNSDLTQVGIFGDKAPEGDGSLTFSVELSKSAGEEISVDYATENSSATAGEDYAETAGTLTFSPGETEKTVSVDLIDDAKWEQDEKFTVKLSNAVNAGIEKKAQRANGVIVNDDEKKATRPQLSIIDAEAAENEEMISFMIELSEASEAEVNIDYETSDGSAIASEDYEGASGTIVFLAGETQQELSVVLLNDQNPEGDEEFYVTLSNAVNADISSGEAIGYILDDEQEIPELSISDSEGPEGGQVEFTVTLSASSQDEIQVDYATSDKSGKAGQDYKETSGTLFISPGETVQTIGVSLLEDDDSRDENFVITLSNPVNAVLNDMALEASGTILDND